MATFQNTVTIARPADEVFAFLADFSNIPAWNYTIERTWQTSPGPAGVGATYRQARTLPRSSEEGFEVTGFEPPSRLAAKGQIGPFHATTKLPVRACRGRDPAHQHRRAGTGFDSAAPARPAGVPRSQGGGGAEPQCAAAAPGSRAPQRRRRLVMFLNLFTCVQPLEWAGRLPGQRTAGYGALR